MISELIYNTVIGITEEKMYNGFKFEGGFPSLENVINYSVRITDPEESVNTFIYDFDFENEALDFMETINSDNDLKDYNFDSDEFEEILEEIYNKVIV